MNKYVMKLCYFLLHLPRIGIQFWKGFPVKPCMQIHIGEWLIVWHWALIPQVPGQGSRHLFCWHILLEGQSVLTEHSGRHPSYGFPEYPDEQTHDAALFRSLQMALLPQGDGVQGCWRGSVSDWREQKTNGSPTYPCAQTQFGVWLTTRHSAIVPHAPIQGSAHLLLIHAKLFEHSLLLEHSGRQLGGAPIYCGIQEHDGKSLMVWQIALGPQGEGMHGFIWIGNSIAEM